MLERELLHAQSSRDEAALSARSAPPPPHPPFRLRWLLAPVLVLLSLLLVPAWVTGPALGLILGIRALSRYGEKHAGEPLA